LTTDRRTGFFYGWTIAACALLTLLVSNGMTISGITAFDESLLKEFGWSRGGLKFRDLIQFALGGLLAPFAGALADRFGIKRLIMLGAALLALCFVAYSRVSSLPMMYGIQVVIATVLSLAGLVVSVLLVSRWFVKKRGTAIGLTLVGTSLGGVILPPLGAALIGGYGWRTAFLIEALIPLALFVLIGVLVKDSPQEMGLSPLGSETAAGSPSAALSGMSYGAALRTTTFWAISVCAMTTFYSILGVQSHLVLHLRGLGFTPAAAAGGLSLMYVAGLVGKFLFGYLADILDRKMVFVGNIAVMLLGSLCLSSMNPALFWPFVLLFGFGWGGLYTLLQLLTMDSFGLKAGGKILGTITVLDALGGGLGPWVSGVLFDKTGNYQASFLVVSGLITAALLIALTLRVPKAGGAVEAGAR
jgi:sugar phosphate permease